MFKISNIIKGFDYEFDRKHDPQIYFNALERLKELFDQILDKKTLNRSQLEKVISQLNDDFSSHEDIFINNFFHLKDSEDFLSFHVLNTMFLSSALCQWAGISNDLTEKASSIAFFLNLSLKHVETILKTKKELSEQGRVLIEKHSSASGQIFSSVYPQDKSIAYFIENHHNYNFRTKFLESKQLKKICKFVLLSGSFEFFIHPQPQHEAVSPHEAINKITSGFRNVDKLTKKEFISYIGMYPITTLVMLNNGQRAVVIGQNKRFPLRPKVRILEEENNQKGKLIDLLIEKDIFIKEVVE